MPNSLEIGIDKDDIKKAADDVAHLVEHAMKHPSSRYTMDVLNNMAGMLGSNHTAIAASAYLLSLGVAASVDHEGKIPIGAIYAMEYSVPILKAAIERFEAAAVKRKGNIN